MKTLTKKQINALKYYWKKPVKVSDGKVLLKKGNCWGVLGTVENQIKNANMIINGKAKGIF